MKTQLPSNTIRNSKQIFVGWVSGSVNLEPFWFYGEDEIVSQPELKAVSPVASACHLLTHNRLLNEIK
ncbi:MAG: hypothetical protein AUG89_08120 [Acidobacteria bacterium 13_1_20CM_4_56_7]|jgi:hypothetical protein|nr:MAG: hypothetical protein AUG89_08120 [Acidobacteria bacterium 13_1_20CM_4_56_7]PYV47970.1 MAG: hypothetical protein DMG92_15080 [Acidobacteriota bacterium]